MSTKHKNKPEYNVKYFGIEKLLGVRYSILYEITTINEHFNSAVGFQTKFYVYLPNVVTVLLNSYNDIICYYILINNECNTCSIAKREF